MKRYLSNLSSMGHYFFAILILLSPTIILFESRKKYVNLLYLNGVYIHHELCFHSQSHTKICKIKALLRFYHFKKYLQIHKFVLGLQYFKNMYPCSCACVMEWHIHGSKSWNPTVICMDSDKYEKTFWTLQSVYVYIILDSNLNSRIVKVINNEIINQKHTAK